ncbi:MAG: cobalamin biosynthesis protein CbiD, partial [Ruminococcus sp.]|nr:cobalamin biosynthesis protein CbiD [Ruminococcus sp.]
MDKYIYHDGKMLRRGYTTGTCAAAASAAAARMLFGLPCEEIELTVPSGDTLILHPVDMKCDGSSALCAVIKDSGDDPDVTNGVAVYSKVELTESGFEITGGRGVGKVTQAGLDRPVGDFAINTVPRSMIKTAVLDVCKLAGYDKGIRVTIYVPGGEELALKTYNPRLGIVGGISIIGTSGIVEPMSTTALLDTVRLEMNMRKAEGRHSIILTLGNYGAGYLAKELSFIGDKNVNCSNFIGDALDIAMELGFENVLIAGHIGKLVKLGTGI